ncbi:MAG: FHA domain-containing protein [Planctomycetia bacterium]|nr:FHA domain-containing protein [Planctomycetia bacterium]
MDIILRIQDNNTARQFVKQVPLPCVIGRGKDTNLTIAHPLVSRKHCALLVSAGKLILRDLDSLNGTYIGMRRITKDHPLNLGEVFSVGAINFQCERVVHGKNAQQQKADPAGASQNIPRATMVPQPGLQPVSAASTVPIGSVNTVNEILNSRSPKDAHTSSIILDKSGDSPASLDSSTFAVLPQKKEPDIFPLASDNNDLSLMPEEEDNLTIVQDSEEDDLELIDDPIDLQQPDSKLQLNDGGEPDNPFRLPAAPNGTQNDPFFGTPKNPFES